jgi:hypothetical protein
MHVEATRLGVLRYKEAGSVSYTDSAYFKISSLDLMIEIELAATVSII